MAVTTYSNFKTLDTYDTEYSADSVEWCPHEPHRNVFVCGTYQLVENGTTKQDGGDTEQKSAPRERVGRIFLFAFKKTLQLLQTIECPAVLDQKWCHNTINGHSVLGVVNAQGYLQIYQLKECDHDTVVQLELVAEVSCACDATENNVVALSLDFSIGMCSSNSEDISIVVSDSKGDIHVFKLCHKVLTKQSSWHAHDFEAWIAAFDYWNTSVIYTGGDDCKFLSFDQRVGHIPVSVNKASSAGVTSLHCNALKQYVLASGSYDETLRIWDTRNMKRPTTQLDLGGGIWRLKWDPITHTRLLAACMHMGFCVVSWDALDVPVILATYTEHDSIAYGADWCHLSSQRVIDILGDGSSQDEVILIGMCSFYDHKLSVTRFSGNK